MRSKLKLRTIGILGAAVAGACAFGMAAQAQPVRSTTLINAPIDEHNLVTLTGNTRHEARAKKYDHGALPQSEQLQGLELLLRRSPVQEQEFDQVMADLHNPGSKGFHQWLTAKEIGQRYGLGQSDLGKVTGWLESHNLHVSGISPDHTFIAFGGAAGDVGAAFHTEIHTLVVNGEEHFANVSDPQIPAALAPAVYGVVQMHDFRPHTMFTKMVRKNAKGKYTVNAGCFPNTPAAPHSDSFTNECFLVTPSDMATIYNYNPLFKAGITGLGQTVVVVEDTYVYKQADFSLFRAVMGLSSYTHGTFTEESPTGAAACAVPPVNGDEGEAILDVEYSTASAPNAAIVLAACTDTGNTNATFGGLKAIQNLIAQGNHPNIISMSYGECESENGATANAAYNTTFKSAAAEGVSVYVSSGDESAVSCDADLDAATHGLNISGFASSQYDIAVGGTDFAENTNASSPTNWQNYWSPSNGPGYLSAMSYIPEIPWNDSCASEIMSTFYGYSQTYGPSGFCSSYTASTFVENFWTTGSGSGGPSGCATGTPSKTGIVGGSCAGWAKPSYQAGFAGIVSNDGVRDIPDVSFFAANGVWGQYYPFCDSDPADAPTNSGFPSGCYTADPANWAGAGGTSFASPIFAGIQALINQKTGQKWGNTNAQYYALAAAEYGATGNPSCSSDLGAGESSSCVFNDITSGDFNVNCDFTVRGSRITFVNTAPNCYLGGGPIGTVGVGSYSGNNAAPGYGIIPTSYVPMYKATTGWDFTTGIGTPNVANLVNAFAAMGH
jgi:subtilase family serine protease